MVSYRFRPLVLPNENATPSPMGSITLHTPCQPVYPVLRNAPQVLPASRDWGFFYLLHLSNPSYFSFPELRIIKETAVIQHCSFTNTFRSFLTQSKFFKFFGEENLLSNCSCSVLAMCPHLRPFGNCLHIIELFQSGNPGNDPTHSPTSIIVQDHHLS